MNALILYRTPQNRHSFSVLLGALEGGRDAGEYDVISVDSAKASGLRDIAGRYRRVLACFSFCTQDAPASFAALGRLKKQDGNKGVLFAAGGPHASGDPAGTLAAGFDIVVAGEGEETLPGLAQSVFAGKGYRGIPGTVCREGRRLVAGPERKQVPLDAFPPFEKKDVTFGYIELTRGCPWGCKFCQVSRLFGKEVRHRSADTVCAWIEELMAKKLSDVRFITPNALAYGSSDGKTPDKGALERLLKGMKKTAGRRGRIFLGSFPSEVRPDFVDRDTIALLRAYTDNDNIILGAQSGSDRILRETGRGHSVEDIRRSAALALEAGFKVNADFIFGLPGETREDAFATLYLVDALAARGVKIHAHTFMPLAGTPYADAAPVRMRGDILKTYRRMASEKQLYGAWERQRGI